ncbi:MAG: alpha/beta fold hydrolase [Nitrososphaeria archaeon]
MPKVNVNDIEVYYEDMGSSEPIIWINGFADDHLGWLPHAKDFSRRYRYIIFDNRGVGQTDKPDIPYSIRIMADDTASLIEALRLGHVHIVCTLWVVRSRKSWP